MHERRIRCDRLEAAPLAAAARRPVGNRGDVPELPGSPAEPVIDVAARHDAEADAASDRQCHEVLGVAPASVKALEDRERVDVVVHEDWDSESSLKSVAKLELAPADHR